ncbi:hypothetical protein ACP4OV_031142 [Aristida adscensionis]
MPMASSSSSSSFSSSSSVAVLFAVLFLVCPYAAMSAAGAGGSSSCYKRMFSFGDSFNDVGNFVTFNPTIGTALPYGVTFFHQPTGRFSDGRLVVDFIAEALRLPLLPAYLRGKTAEDFRQGANFAVAGATALPQSFFRDMGLVPSIIPPYSLDVQLEWFNDVLHLLASTEQGILERKDVMENSLFLMGEVGLNDYNHPFTQNRSLTTVKPLVPKVIAKIEHAVKALISLGAKNIVVPGNVPMGCMPRFLAMFQSKNPGDYDQFGCLKWLNDFAKHHNRELKRILCQIPHDPTVKIMYADYYGAIREITTNPLKHGFSEGEALIACCGNGSPYNSGPRISCNATSVLCPDLSKSISWDGLHYTEAANHFVAHGMLDGPYTSPSILSKCRS